MERAVAIAARFGSKSKILKKTFRGHSAAHVAGGPIKVSPETACGEELTENAHEGGRGKAFELLDEKTLLLQQVHSRKIGGR